MSNLLSKVAMSPGSPAQIMLGRLRGLILRLRQTLPLEIKGEELLRAVYPPQITELQQYDDVQWNNVRQGLSHADLLFMEYGNDVAGTIFWYRFAAPVPVPKEAMEAVRITDEAPFAKELSAWLQSACAIDEDIQATVKMLHEVCASLKHPVHVAKYWPELGQFVLPMMDANENFKRDHPYPFPSPSRIPTVSEKTRTNTINMLNTAVLLPDTTPTAWVGFHR